MTTLYLWKKTVISSRVNTWLERLAVAVPPERLAVVSPISGRTQSLQAYVDSEGDAIELKRQFGGQVSVITPDDWLPPPSTSPGNPLSFGRNLFVTGREEELIRLRSEYPRRHVLCIPAAMAFGTGEHATTAMCLRFLSQVSVRQRATGPWDLLDLGTGSGVLALAGRLFGARRANGYDNDPHAVRTASENAALNGVSRTRFKRLDLLRRPWPASVSSGWPVITANLFSELLIALLPQIVGVLSYNGQLIASGILATQAAEVEIAMQANALAVKTKRRRGRWVAYLACKSSGKQINRK